MQTYIGIKMIRAKAMTRGDYDKLRECNSPADENPNDEGFLVEYLDGGKANHKDYDGYISWSPKDVFERAYRPVTGMTFGQAIEAMKNGKKVARRGWNGKGMYLWLMPAATVKAEWCREPHLKEVAEANGGEIECLGTIRMFTHDSTGRKAVLTGWLASQSDMLCEDWVVVA
jgi:GMP synthase-like glutamine amidotransferase